METNNKSVLLATDQNFEEVRQSSKVVLLDFGATWCPACKMMEPILDELAGNFAGLVTISKVDVEDNAGLTSQYGVRTIPALVIFKEGEVIKRYTGFTPKSVLTKDLSSLISLTV
jgi:thioredoxin 1